MPLLQMLSNDSQFPLRADCPRVYPYQQMVNRVIHQKLDPFIVETPVETIQQVKERTYQPHKTFYDLCCERLHDLYRAYRGKPKYIYWSGGVDSSLVVAAFLDQIHAPEDIDSTFIVLTSDSVSEFPEMFGDIVRGKFNMMHSHLHMEQFAATGAVITGEFGDQLMGSDVIKVACRFYGQEVIHKPWQQYVPDMYFRMFGQNQMIEKYEQTTLASEYPIKTVQDWLWWFNFTNKWNSVKYRMLKVTGWQNAATTFMNVHHFYDSVDFQLWAMNNPHLKIGETLKSYKFHMKDLIIQITGHEEYANKRKVGSAFNLWTIRPQVYGIDTDFNPLTKEQVMEYINV